MRCRRFDATNQLEKKTIFFHTKKKYDVYFKITAGRLSATQELRFFVCFNLNRLWNTMDIAMYLVAAAILIVLILFALKVRMKTQEGKLTLIYISSQ